MSVNNFWKPEVTVRITKKSIESDPEVSPQNHIAFQ